MHRSRIVLVLLSCSLWQCSGSTRLSGNVSQPGTESSRKTSASTTLDKSGYLFDPADRSCDGFPRLQVGTMDGTCLGLVMPQARAEASGLPWKMPRTIQQIPGSKDFLVVDMGGWVANRGALYHAKQKPDGQYELSMAKSGLNMPHALKWGPGGFFYLGETDKVWRFRFSNGQVSDLELVVAKLPRYKGYMHPLVALAFDPRNDDMYINSGAPSDHCFVKNRGTYSDCPEDTEAGLAVIFRVPGAKLKNIPPGGITTYEVAAHGLRNSMAMEVHPSGMLVQGENGRDFPQLEEPYEEINAIDLAEHLRGKHFGWPYCYNFHAVSPEWKFSQNLGDPLHKRFTAPVDCSAKEAQGPGEYQPPHALMPPHVAPLHLGYYPNEGKLAALFRGKLLMTWHGYQATGHRLVAYSVDARGLPKVLSQLSGKETYAFDAKGTCPTQKAFKPEGGLDRVAPYTEVISVWDEVKGSRPKGAPVGFTIADDGSIFIVEDKNHTIVRLAASERGIAGSCSGTPSGNVVDPRIEMLAWRAQLETNPNAKAGYETIRDGILKKYCSSCHGGFAETEIANDEYSQLDFLVKNEFFVPQKAMASKLFQALAQTGEVPAMPPADVTFPAEAQATVPAVKAWIDSLPEISGAIKKTAMKESRKIRLQPSASAQECGQLSPGDLVHIDPRANTQTAKDGWLWARVYLLPGDSRLYKNGCAYPRSGSFFVATVRQ